MKRRVIGDLLPGLPISPAVQVDSFLFVAGQVGAHSKTGAVAGSDIESQTRLALQNLRSVLSEAGSDLSKVDTVTVYLIDRADFAGMNQVYQEFFLSEPPARTTLIVAGLAREDLLVEITVTAHV